MNMRVSVFLYAVSFSTALALVHGTHDMLKHHACGSALTVSFIFFHFHPCLLDHVVEKSLKEVAAIGDVLFIQYKIRLTSEKLYTVMNH